MKTEPTSKKYLLMFLLPLLLVSCSIFSGKSTRSIDLSEDNFISANGFHVTKVAASPHTYKLSTQELSSFFTIVKECGINPRTSLVSVNRELFVGLNNLKILSQEKIGVKEQIVLVSTAEAQVDGSRILITTYSILKESCVTDIVFWSSRDKDDERSSSSASEREGVKEYSGQLDPFVEELIPRLS